ncbi:MAG: TolC family protein [Bryobacterales bacterium]|nr:TolC family protein [Bryobacteraceae bacterium]MDW8131786.1 TolC family protein [Bryobacterales bacterium]
MRTVALLLIGSVTLLGQPPLSLKQAVEIALRQHPQVQAAASSRQAADARIQAARGGYLPKLHYSESFQRTNNPVYVFGALLTQARFTERNFALSELNRPDFLNNFQSQLALEQVVYDGGLTRQAVRAAELGRQVAGEEERRARQGVIAAVVRAYFGAVLAEESLKTAQEAVRSAQADLERARAMRSAGLITDADVLSLEVHLAAMREQRIRRAADLEVARAALNEALGLPLDRQHALVTALTPVSLPAPELASYERNAVEQRPETRQAALAVRLAEAQTATARAALLPQVVFRSVFETDRQRFVTRGAANWLAAVALRWNLFNGFADRQRVREAEHTEQRAEAERRRAEALVRLHVRQAYAAWQAALERTEVAKAAVSQAEESLRITKNRYENGLATVTDLLRTETAVLEARNRHLAALYDQRVAAVELVLAAGMLSPDSPVLE